MSWTHWPGWDHCEPLAGREPQGPPKTCGHWPEGLAWLPAEAMQPLVSNGPVVGVELAFPSLP